MSSFKFYSTNKLYIKQRLPVEIENVLLCCVQWKILYFRIMFTIYPGIYVLNFCKTYNAKKIIYKYKYIYGHNRCTVPTLWPSFRYFSRSLNSGNLECMSYWDIKYFTAKKLKREHHSSAFPCFMHYSFLITFHFLGKKCIQIQGGRPGHG